MTVILSDLRHLPAVSALPLTWDKVRWVYFAENYARAEQLRADWAARGAREINYRDDYVTVCRDLRERFSDDLATFGRRQPADEWLCSGSAERGLNATLFPDICRLFLAAQRAAQWQAGGLLIFVSSRPGLLLALQRIFPTARAMFSPVPAYPAGSDARVPWRLPRRGELPPPTPLLLRSWAGRRSFDAAGNYVDAYWGSLLPFLESRNIPFTLLLQPLDDATRVRLAALRSRGRLSMLFTDELLPLAAQMRLWWRERRRQPLRVAAARLCGVDAAPLLADNEAADAPYQRCRRFLAEEEIVKVLARRGWQPARYLFPCEGQAWEKILCRAVRRHWPGCRTVGYVHTIVTPQFQFYRPGRDEAAYTDYPDAMLTVGEITADELRTRHYPGRIEAGAALRHEYLFSARHRPAAGRRRVLVPLPLMITSATQLAVRVAAAWGGRTDVEVWIKEHPVVPLDAGTRDRVLAHANFREVTQPLPEILPQCDLVVYYDSTVALEALALGIPVVHFRLDYEIDLDSLEAYPEMQTVTTDLATLPESAWQAPAGAAEFCRRYWYPPTDPALARFAGLADR